MIVTLYTKPSCPHCVLAKEYLREHGIGFEEVDVSADPAALAFLRERGHRAVPQLYVGSTLLVEGGNSGLRAAGAETIRDRLRRLKAGGPG